MNQVSSLSNIDYPTTPSHLYCDVAFGVGLALESSGVATAFAGLPYLGLSAMLTGRSVRIIESMFCKNTDVIDSIWNSPFDFVSDIYQLASIYGHHKYTRFLQKNIQKFNNAKKINLPSLKKAYDAALKTAKKVQANLAAIPSGATQAALRQNVLSLAKHSQNAEQKMQLARQAKDAWDIAKASISPSEWTLKIFKPLHLALATLPPCLVKVWLNEGVKEQEVVNHVTYMLQLSDIYGIVYDRSEDLLDLSHKINLDLKDIVSQAYVKICEKINSLIILNRNLLMLLNSKASESKQEKVIKEITTLHHYIEKEFGLEKSFFINFINDPKNDESVVADGTKPLFDLQQIAITALQDLDPDAINGFNLGFEMRAQFETLTALITYLVSITEEYIDVASSSSSKNALLDVEARAKDILVAVDSGLKVLDNKYKGQQTVNAE